MHEIIINLHMHTTYSDGQGSHADIVKAALKANLDGVIVTDHNILVEGVEGSYEKDGKHLILLIGEEVHDQARVPQKNHLLVFGAHREMAPLAADPQSLLDQIRKAGGLAFIAHPIDPAAPAFDEGDISWVDWQVQGFTGIELWNGFSEFKSLLRSKLHAIYYAYLPQRIARGPHPEALAKWDELLANGQKIVAIGGSDAHALSASMGPLHRVLFPYFFHFSGINNHLISPDPLTGEFEHDRSIVLETLAMGRVFIGYDLPAPTRGFRFTAQGLEQTAHMGDTISAKNGVTFQIHLPKATECRLIKDGSELKVWDKKDTCTLISSEPGIYRVEVKIQYLGHMRGWIYSNPIYVI
jgi:hypothetical protein